MKNIILRRVGISFAILFFLVAIAAPAPIFANTKGGVNPGNTFYAFDIFFEKVDLALTFNKDKRIQKIMANTEERLAEAEEAVAENKPDIAEKALAKYQEGVSLAIVEAKGIDDKEKSKETLSIIGDNVLKHKDVLTAVYSSVPEISKESMEKVIAISATEQEETKEELDQVIISQQVNEDSVKAQKEAEKNITVENQNKKEKKQETNININIAPKTKEEIVFSEQKQVQSNSATVSTDTTSKSTSIPATIATTNNNPLIPVIPTITANPGQSNSSSNSSSISSNSSAGSSSSISSSTSSSNSSMATSSSSLSVATSSSSSTNSTTPAVNDNLGPWITNLSISPTNINPGGLVTFAVTAEDPNGIGSIVVDIKYPPCACHDSDYYLRPNFNFSGATSGTQTFTETIDHGTSPTILGDYAIVTIRAVDSLGNISTYYPNGTVTGAKQGTHALTIPVIKISDSTSPSVPTGLSATTISANQVSLSWIASTDNISVVGYKVFRHGLQIATTTTNFYTDSGLYSKTSYGYAISAYDSTGNESDRSSSLDITTDTSTNPAVKLPDDWKNPNDFSHILTSGRQQVAKFQLWANVPGIEWKQISLHVSLSPGLTVSNWEIQDQSNTAYTYGVSAVQDGDTVTFSTSGLGIYNTYSGVGYSVYAQIDGNITPTSTITTKFINDTDFVWNNTHSVEGLPTVPQTRYGSVQ